MLSHILTAQKKKFSIKDFFSKCDQIFRKLDFTQEILNGKLHFLCSICYHFYWLIKKVFSINDNIAILYFCSWEKISIATSSMCFIFKQQNKKSVYFLKIWINLNNLKYGFCAFIDTFDWYLFQLIVLSKPDFNCCSNFELSSKYFEITAIT